MKRAILVDFDGTMTMVDTAVLVLERFARDDWRKYDDMLGKGLISLEDCMSRQFEMVAATEKEIINFLDDHVKLRPGIKKFFSKGMKSDHSLTIVSAGLRFYIEHVLEKNGWSNVSLVTGLAIHKNGHIQFEFPRIRNAGALDFKQDEVLDRRRRYGEVVYIGDGNSDFNAARSANTVLAVKDSRLAEMCQIENLPYTQFEDFSSILNFI